MHLCGSFLIATRMSTATCCNRVPTQGLFLPPSRAKALLLQALRRRLVGTPPGEPCLGNAPLRLFVPRPARPHLTLLCFGHLQPPGKARREFINGIVTNDVLSLHSTDTSTVRRGEKHTCRKHPMMPPP